MQIHVPTQKVLLVRCAVWLTRCSFVSTSLSGCDGSSLIVDVTSTAHQDVLPKHTLELRALLFGRVSHKCMTHLHREWKRKRRSGSFCLSEWIEFPTNSRSIKILREKFTVIDTIASFRIFEFIPSISTNDWLTAVFCFCSKLPKRLYKDCIQQEVMTPEAML